MAREAARTASAHVVWITRTQPAAEATARRVRARDLEAVVAPLLAVRPIESAVLDMDGVCAIAFTSANAVRAFAERSATRDIRVFTVGDATAEAARAVRFATVLSAQGDVRALAAALAARRRELSGVVLNPTAAEPAADLAGALEAVGLRVRQTPLYETTLIEPPPDLLERLPQIDHVLLHSAKAARALARLLKTQPAPHMTALALSREVAKPLARAGLAAVRVAAEPKEAMLLAMLEAPSDA
jgi:uroporphyrinogen-III synthase